MSNQLCVKYKYHGNLDDNGQMLSPHWFSIVIFSDFHLWDWSYSDFASLKEAVNPDNFVDFLCFHAYEECDDDLDKLLELLEEKLTFSFNNRSYFTTRDRIEQAKALAESEEPRDEYNP